MNMDTTQCFPISDHMSFPRVSFLCLTVAHGKTHELDTTQCFPISERVMALRVLFLCLKLRTRRHMNMDTTLMFSHYRPRVIP